MGIDKHRRTLRDMGHGVAPRGQQFYSSGPEPGFQLLEEVRIHQKGAPKKTCDCFPGSVIRSWAQATGYQNQISPVQCGLKGSGDLIGDVSNHSNPKNQ